MVSEGEKREDDQLGNWLRLEEFGKAVRVMDYSKGKWLRPERSVAERWWKEEWSEFENRLRQKLHDFVMNGEELPH